MITRVAKYYGGMAAAGKTKKMEVQGKEEKIKDKENSSYLNKKLKLRRLCQPVVSLNLVC